MTPDPCEAHTRMTVPAVVCIKNYSKKFASFAESITAHPSEMSAKCLLYARAMSMCMFTESKCINSGCSCARHQMGCS